MVDMVDRRHKAMLAVLIDRSTALKRKEKKEKRGKKERKKEKNRTECFMVEVSTVKKSWPRKIPSVTLSRPSLAPRPAPFPPPPPPPPPRQACSS